MVQSNKTLTTNATYLAVNNVLLFPVILINLLLLNILVDNKRMAFK